MPKRGINKYDQVTARLTGCFDAVLGDVDYEPRIDRVRLFVQKLMHAETAAEMAPALASATTALSDHLKEFNELLRHAQAEESRHTDKMARKEAVVMLKKIASFEAAMKTVQTICQNCCMPEHYAASAKDGIWTPAAEGRSSALDEFIRAMVEAEPVCDIVGDLRAPLENLSAHLGELLRFGRERTTTESVSRISDRVQNVKEGLSRLEKATMKQLATKAVELNVDLKIALQQLSSSMHTFTVHAVLAVTEHVRLSNQMTSEDSKLQRLFKEAQKAMTHADHPGAVNGGWCRKPVREGHLLSVTNDTLGNLRNLRSTKRALYEHLEAQVETFQQARAVVVSDSNALRDTQTLLSIAVES